MKKSRQKDKQGIAVCYPSRTTALAAKHVRIKIDYKYAVVLESITQLRALKCQIMFPWTTVPGLFELLLLPELLVKLAAEGEPRYA